MNPDFIRETVDGMLNDISDLFNDHPLTTDADFNKMHTERELEQFWLDVTASLEARISEIRGMS